ncbi:conserved hypothetical protein [Vibrio phage 424E50-1]|nr:conserved hypothetical protein [Vibrio phage 424E50-1]
MFDANASGVPVGKKFFVEVHSVNSELTKMGVIRGDILLCEHVVKTPTKFCEENTLTYIWAKNNDQIEVYRYNDSEAENGYGLMVYSGCPDGNGFINDKWKAKALDFLGGTWDV